MIKKSIFPKKDFQILPINQLSVNTLWNPIKNTLFKNCNLLTIHIIKKIIPITVLALAIISCAPSENSSKTIGLQGVWDRIGTIYFEDGKPKDTVPFDAKSKQVKFYTTENFMFVANGKRLDSLGVDRNIGFAGNGTYKVENDSLFEFMSHGTDNYLQWIEAGNKIYSVKISLTENHYTQYTIDSLGKGSGELYKRLE